MNKIEKCILEQTKNYNDGLLSPVTMINGIAKGHCKGSQKSVENLVVRGYLENVPVHTQSTLNGTRKYLFYRVTEKGLNILSPWHKRIWFAMKDDVKAILISVITAVITTVITTIIISRLLP